MRNKRMLQLLGLVMCLTSLQVWAADGNKPLYKDAKAPVERRVEDLLSRMSLEEKVYQLNQYTLGSNNNINNIGEAVKNVPAEIGSVIYFDENPQLRNELQKKAMKNSRLGIPVLFGYDVIHGFRTVYPIPLAQACSWNPLLVEQASAVAAQEARSSGVDWTFSPMIDVARDARWGRVAEGYGEDPYTTGVFAAASVKGYQGDDMASDKRVAACLKHYVGYGASEAGRDYVYTEISGQSLWNTYLPPYEAGVKAGAATLMSGFNDISGVPASANHYTLTEVLKNRWKHDGFVVSDWASVVQLVNQGVAANGKEAAEKAFMAGVEMDMVDNCYQEHLAKLVEEGKVPMQSVDEAVRRVLRVKFRLGLFDHPYTKEIKPEKRFLMPQNLRLVEQLAEETMVLLKNSDNLLPLSDVKTIALVGPLAKEQADLLGSWSGHGRAGDVCSIFDAVTREFSGKADILYAQGCGFEGTDRDGFAEALAVAKRADAVVLCLGEKRGWSGENASRSTIALPTIQEELLAALKSAGKPIVVLLSNGRPLELVRIEKQADAIVEMWQPGVAGGKPVAGILSGRVNPSGRLAMTFPYSTGQIPIYYNHRAPARKGSQGRYQDIPSTPLYDFGYGLSYTDYKYGNLTASAERVKRGDVLTVEVAVTNTGKRDGLETVHWFICDPVSSISRPVKELKFFEKQLIKAGETQVFRFNIDTNRDFSFMDSDGKRFLEPGDYYILVKDQKLKVHVE